MTDQPVTRAGRSRASACVCTQPASPPQRTPKAPDTPWGQLRGKTGWSLRQLAERTGINPADLSRIERGIGGPTPNQARRLLEVFDG